MKETLGGISTVPLGDIKYGPDDVEIAQAFGKPGPDEKGCDSPAGRNRVVKTAVSDYRIVLVGGKISTGAETPGLEPQVARKRKAMVDNNLTEMIKADEDTLKEKEGNEQLKKKDYDKFVGLAFTKSRGRLSSGWRLRVEFSERREAARKEKNVLIDQVRELRAKVKGEKALQKAVETLADDFSDIGTRMLDAETALGHLDYMWASILSLIEDSQQQWKNINDGMRLSTFTTAFKTVINPWKSVGDLSGELIRIIDEALADTSKGTWRHKLRARRVHQNPASKRGD